MIELAPNHKMGLTLRNPVLIAGGVLSIGEPIPRAIHDSGIGAIIVGSITHSSRRGITPPRLADSGSGFVLSSGLQNRGIRNTVKRLIKTRNRIDCPLIAQVADRECHHLRRVVEYLEMSGTCDGLELLVHQESNCDELHELLSAMREISELPIWVKLPFVCSEDIIVCAGEGGADAIVVSQPPVGAYLRMGGSNHENRQALEDSLITGSVIGTGTLPQSLARVNAISAMQLPIPTILCGGVHNEHDVDAALAAGAAAIQLDGALWVEPGLAKDLVQYCNVTS